MEIRGAHCTPPGCNVLSSKFYDGELPTLPSWGAARVASSL